ncbi:MAG: PAC2 family protein [Chloroflexi bacterium]|nr:PAC2 family protein [Chloroflexota bacterium]
MASYLTVEEHPPLQAPTLVAAFAGWPDAGEVASGSLRYLLRKLRARRFASIDPEEFYDFTDVRPHTTLVRPWERQITWPSNEFHYWQRPGGPDLVLFLGREPSLRWRTYIATLFELIDRLGVRQVVTLGGTFDSVPHRGEPRVSGAAADPQLRAALQALGVSPSTYEGPTSIHSALLDACRQRGLPAGSLWGHAPHYLQAAPNVKVCYGVLRKLAALLDLPVDLEEIRGAARALELRVERLLADNEQLQAYVRQLEESEGVAPEREPEETEPPPMPSPEAVLQELEEFLRQQRQQDGDAPPGRTDS